MCSLKSAKIAFLYACTILMFLHQVPFLMSLAGPTPVWAEAGARLDYDGELSNIDFYFFNRSEVPDQLLNTEGATIIGGDSTRVGLLFEHEVPARLSLVIEEMQGQTGVVRTTIKIGAYSSSTTLIVDFSKREVSSLDGSPLGQATLWIWPCGNGDTIRFVEHGNSTVFAKVSLSDRAMSTVKGPQDTLILTTTGERMTDIPPNMSITPTEAQSDRFFIQRLNHYDADTFVMIDGFLDEDPFVSAFGIMTLSGVFSLVDTNIDLGPANLLVLLVWISPYFVLILTIVGSVAYFWSAKKRAMKGT